MKTFEIIKKNRKYFSAKTNGYKCKILIDDYSSNLELGIQELEVDDISVRSKYGVDLIFKLSASAEDIKDAGICTLKTDFYNTVLLGECRDLGGKWDDQEKAWIFSGLVEKEVEDLDIKYNSEMIGIEILFNSECSEWQEAINLAGFNLAKASGRDSGAKVFGNISVIEKGFTSGGSVKNWTTRVTEGTVIRMYIPSECLADFEEEYGIEVKVLDNEQ